MEIGVQSINYNLHTKFVIKFIVLHFGCHKLKKSVWHNIYYVV